MASGSKKKTTMAKLNRERKLRERRLDKHARKDARKQARADQEAQPGHMSSPDDPASTPSEDAQGAAPSDTPSATL